MVCAEVPFNSKVPSPYTPLALSLLTTGPLTVRVPLDTFNLPPEAMVIPATEVLVELEVKTG
jgi:hypothetical protein